MLAEQDSFRGVISELDHAVTALQSSTDLAAVGPVHEQVSVTACLSQVWAPSLLLRPLALQVRFVWALCNAYRTATRSTFSQHC